MVVFRLFSQLCSHQHYLILEHFITLKRNPISIASFTQPLASATLQFFLLPYIYFFLNILIKL